jgi:hypothetical protein
MMKLLYLSLCIIALCWFGDNSSNSKPITKPTDSTAYYETQLWGTWQICSFNGLIMNVCPHITFTDKHLINSVLFDTKQTPTWKMNTYPFLRISKNSVFRDSRYKFAISKEKGYLLLKLNGVADKSAKYLLSHPLNAPFKQ